MNVQKIGKVFTSKSVRTGPSSYKKKGIYWAAVSRRLRNTVVDYSMTELFVSRSLQYVWKRCELLHLQRLETTCFVLASCLVKQSWLF